MQSKYMTMKEAAGYIRKTERTVLRILQKSDSGTGPKLKYKRVGAGGSYLFLQSDLDKYLTDSAAMTDDQINAIADRKLISRRTA